MELQAYLKLFFSNLNCQLHLLSRTEQSVHFISGSSRMLCFQQSSSRRRRPLIRQRIGCVQSITPQREWHPLGALIFLFLVAFSGFNPTLAKLNWCTGNAGRRESGGHCFFEVREQSFSFQLQGTCAVIAKLRSTAFCCFHSPSPLFSHRRRCALKISNDHLYKNHRMTIQRQRGPEIFQIGFILIRLFLPSPMSKLSWEYI